MNVQRDPDAIIAAWLEEGPNRLPEETRRAIAVTTRTIDQRWRPRWVPWRIPLMSSSARVAVAVIVAIAAIGAAVYVIGPGQGVGGPPPTPRPTITSTPSSAPPSVAQATVPTDWATYTSSRFGYTIDYPVDWVATPATYDWPSYDFPDKAGHEHDVFVGPSTTGQLFVSSVPLTKGKTVADWIAQLDTLNADHHCQFSPPRTITVDGLSARQEAGVCMGVDQIIEVVMADDKRLYQINLFDEVGTFSDKDRTTFDRFMASFRFGG